MVLFTKEYLKSIVYCYHANPRSQNDRLSLRIKLTVFEILMNIVFDDEQIYPILKRNAKFGFRIHVWALLGIIHFIYFKKAELRQSFST